MASELDSHYAVARRVAFQVEEQLQELETGRDTSLTFQGNISTNLNQLARELETLEALLATEQDGARRGAWRKKLKQLHDNSAGLRAALEKFATRTYRTQREAEERKELLQRRNAAGHTAIEMSSLSRETRALDEASIALDNLNRHGESVLMGLHSQRGMLNSSRRKLMSIFDSLGLSNSLLRLIERRQMMDRLLVFGGIAACSFLLWVLMRWNRASPLVPAIDTVDRLGSVRLDSGATGTGTATS